jgi:glycosyltransferase involved in cell wall biosynthesis
MRILFLNHTGSRSGAENAMLRLLAGIPPKHERAVACPPEGGLKLALEQRGIEQFDLPGTDISLQLHPVKTVRGLAALVASGLALRRIARRYGADVIHANSVRAGLIAIVARRLGGPPVVVQCHDHLPRNIVGRLTREAIARGSRTVVAVSDYTAAEFNHGLRRAKAERIYISVDHERFSSVEPGKARIREELGLAPDARLLAEVAQITPWKGQDTAIRALERIRERHDAHLLIVGDVAFSSQRFDNVGFRDSLQGLVAAAGLETAVHFLGRRRDVAELIAEIDMLLLPSWDEPFGLVVLEAMAVGTPVLVTTRGGVSEYVTDRVNGRLLPPREPGVWADAIVELLDEPEALVAMGKANVNVAAAFTDERYCSEMLAAYERAASA